MTIISAHKCEIGRVRPQNEDYVWVDKRTGLYIVADGMGGHDAGDVASQMAANAIGSTLVEQLNNHSKPLSSAKIKELMVNAIEAANKMVWDEAHTAGHERKMGTTIVIALVQSTTAYISHAGDSRAYLAQKSGLTQLTEDDSWRFEFGGLGKSKDNVRVGIIEHYLTKAIGQEHMVDPSFKELTLAPGDCLLLCSDGLWGMIEDDQILAELQKIKRDPTKAVKSLVAAANDAGGSDNISAIAIKVAS